MTATQALAQALVAHQPRYYGTPGYWATAVGEMAPDIIANLRAAGWGISNPYREVLDLGEEVDQPSELLAQVRDTIKRGWAKCPLCQGSIRQTVGLTCELCGRYHGKDGEWQ